MFYCCFLWLKSLFFKQAMSGNVTGSPPAWNTLTSYLANITLKGERRDLTGYDLIKNYFLKIKFGRGICFSLWIQNEWFYCSIVAYDFSICFFFLPSLRWYCKHYSCYFIGWAPGRGGPYQILPLPWLPDHSQLQWGCGLDRVQGPYQSQPGLGEFVQQFHQKPEHHFYFAENKHSSDKNCIQLSFSAGSIPYPFCLWNIIKVMIKKYYQTWSFIWAGTTKEIVMYQLALQEVMSIQIPYLNLSQFQTAGNTCSKRKYRLLCGLYLKGIFYKGCYIFC